MAKLGAYSYPDIRFGDAVEIAGRILSKFKGTVSVKGLAWELGMAEGSGTLFAKVAALRDFGLIEGRGELRTTVLVQRLLHPASPAEATSARADAFQRVELLRALYHRFDGEIPDDLSLLVALQEVTRCRREEAIRRAPLLMKHLTDIVRVLGRPITTPAAARDAHAAAHVSAPQHAQVAPASAGTLEVTAGPRRLSLPLSPAYVDVAIAMLETLRDELSAAPVSVATGAVALGPLAVSADAPKGGADTVEAASLADGANAAGTQPGRTVQA